jgi:hypothetical protein
MSGGKTIGIPLKPKKPVSKNYYSAIKITNKKKNLIKLK